MGRRIRTGLRQRSAMCSRTDGGTPRRDLELPLSIWPALAVVIVATGLGCHVLAGVLSPTDDRQLRGSRSTAARREGASTSRRDRHSTNTSQSAWGGLDRGSRCPVRRRRRHCPRRCCRTPSPSSPSSPPWIVSMPSSAVGSSPTSPEVRSLSGADAVDTDPEEGEYSFDARPALHGR